MIDRTLNILFLSTRNTVRSILAEACLNSIAHGRFRAFSAGSWPAESGRPDALAVEVLRTAGIQVEGLHSKSWSEFSGPKAPHMDLVITLCDAVADEACPAWPAHPDKAHWSYPNPAALQVGREERFAAYQAMLHSLHHRLGLLKNLPQGKLDGVMVAEFAQELAYNEIG